MFNIVLATPSVRGIVKVKYINSNSIKGTGKEGRILKEDIDHYLKNKNSKSKQKENLILNEDKVVAITGYKKGMTKAMTKSAEIPSFLYTDEYNTDKLINFRNEINKAYTEQVVKLSFMPFFIKAVSNSLKKFPILNSTVSNKKDQDGLISEFIIKGDHNISIAIDAPEGLVVPNVKSVQSKSIIQIHKDIEELRIKAKNLRLTSNDLNHGTFSISNIGNIGGKILNPCILPPQVTIIAISKMYDSFKIVKKEELLNFQNYAKLEQSENFVAYHKVINFCMSADHRVIDGATLAKFSEILRGYIENPVKIILDDI